MDDAPPEDAETPMQRALRLKKAALQARPMGPGAARARPAKGVPTGASKPWMKK